MDTMHLQICILLVIFKFIFNKNSCKDMWSFQLWILCEHMGKQLSILMAYIVVATCESLCNEALTTR